VEEELQLALAEEDDDGRGKISKRSNAHVQGGKGSKAKKEIAEDANMADLILQLSPELQVRAQKVADRAQIYIQELQQLER
jgi:hypothetical protein